MHYFFHVWKTQQIQSQILSHWSLIYAIWWRLLKVVHSFAHWGAVVAGPQINYLILSVAIGKLTHFLWPSFTWGCLLHRDNLSKTLERLTAEQIHLKDDFNTASNRLRDVREEKLKVLAELNKVKGLRMERSRLLEQISQAQLDFQVTILKILWTPYLLLYLLSNIYFILICCSQRRDNT